MLVVTATVSRNRTGRGDPAEMLRDHRRAFVREVARQVLERTISRHPVDTARSRAAWVKGLLELGGTLPPGWQGSNAEGRAVEEGLAAGEVHEFDDGDLTEIEIINGVPYVGHLEYGTANAPEFAMVRGALAEVVGSIS
ncbi:hypothetical protein [Stratiformator vulcanicus]|uniref:Uncharacterized protein n=1 Tax=Stratiformator vulcanicus TaxID=2527980 RepID=A0A517QWX9_9PLAN|nr:hypothetical protein [Stratiformator vulcanicus]QDT36104.1 hypothetical protein Pan189_04590 [Stratiformator vulcanicus]